MAGLPMVLAAGFWIGGVAAAVLVPPLLGACAVLTFGGLAARLTGPRWAPLAALALALSLPEQFTSRSAYSEPLAQILFLGGLCLVIDSLEGRAGARVIAALGGLALGLTLLVRIDGASDILPVIPYCGILLLSRRRQAVPLLIGLLAGALYGAVDGLVLSRPYLAHIKSSLMPLALVGAVVVIATAVAVAVLWRRGLPRVRGKWLPNAAAVLPVVVVILFTARAYLHQVSNQPIQATATSQQVASWVLQYYMISMRWVFWYAGVPAVLLGTLGAALLARRCLRGQVAVLDAAADGVRVDHRHRPLPAGDLPRPAVGQPQARPGRAARPHPAGGLGIKLARRLGPPARSAPGGGWGPRRLLRGAAARAAGGDHASAWGSGPAARSGSGRSRTAWRSREPTPVRSPR